MALKLTMISIENSVIMQNLKGTVPPIDTWVQYQPTAAVVVIISYCEPQQWLSSCWTEQKCACLAIFSARFKIKKKIQWNIITGSNQKPWASAAWKARKLRLALCGCWTGDVGFWQHTCFLLSPVCEWMVPNVCFPVISNSSDPR